MKYLILLVFSILFLSCSNDQIINPVLLPIDEATIGVKSRIVYPSLESNQIGSIEDFEYNNDGKLIKKIYYSGNRVILLHYEIFNYDTNGKLTYKLGYRSNINSPSGFVLLDSTNYVYTGNFLIVEKTTYPLAKYFDEYTYEYDKNYLIKKTNYHKGELEYFITYEYQDDKVYKEKHNGGIEIKEYIYKDNQLIEIVEREARKRNYSYNENGKLILERVEELSVYSSMASHIVKYFY
ncbi:MAG: hypothetical protein WBG58_17095 [Ignavibacteriaceae bacterium]